MKRISILIALITISFDVKSDTIPEYIILREINEIKCAENAIYAEVLTCLDDVEKDIDFAKQKSMSLLKSAVIETFVKKDKINKQETQNLWNVVEEKAQTLELRKDSTIRIFTYIMKDALGLSMDEHKKLDLDLYFNEGVLAYKDEIANIDSIKIEPDSDTTSTKEIIIPEICVQIMAQKNLPTLIAYLKREKLNENLIYGNVSSMTKPEECYIVIIEKNTNSIVAVLDKGNEERMNFISKQKDQFNNYRGIGLYYAILVQQYNN